MKPNLSDVLSGTLLLSLMLVACGEKPEPQVEETVRPVKMMVLGEAGAGIRLEYPGEVSAAQDVELGFEVPGRIVELPIRDGLQVSAGDVLGKLDPTEYQAAREAAESHRRAMRSAYNRAKRIFDQGAGSQAEVDRTLRDIRVAEEDLKKAQKSLDDTVLRAPFSGRVARKIADNFRNVRAKEPVVKLQDISSLELDVNVPERDFARMTPGLSNEERTRRGRPEIIVSTVPDKRFPARLISFETAADPVTRTYKATFAFDNPPDVSVLPGMTARVVYHIASEPNESRGSIDFLIPVAAVAGGSDGNPYVWRIEPETMQATRVEVTLGDMSEVSVRVLSGLEPGDRIAISGAAHLHEGIRVRPLSK
jgi:RND family efflux transporter MFP subunit